MSLPRGSRTLNKKQRNNNPNYKRRPQWFYKTEEELYNYADMKREIEYLQIALEELDTADIIPLSAVDNSKIKTAKTNVTFSDVEAIVIDRAQKKERYLKQIKARQVRIRKIDSVLKCLTDDEYKLVRLRYLEAKTPPTSWDRMSEILGMSLNNIYVVKAVIIEKVARLLFWDEFQPDN